jgi:hypothetical protein
MLSRIEGFLERLFQAPASLFGARLQPVTLAKRIERAMDTNKSFSDEGVLVPNDYELHLNPADFAGFESYRSALEDDLGHGILARARRERYTLVARPQVRITADRRVPRGDVRVAANLVDDHGDRVRSDRPLPAGSDTMVFRRPGERATPDSAARAYLLVSTRGSAPIQFELGEQQQDPQDVAGHGRTQNSISVPPTSITTRAASTSGDRIGRPAAAK